MSIIRLRPYNLNKFALYMQDNEGLAFELARRYDAHYAIMAVRIFDRLCGEPELDVEIAPSLDDICRKCAFEEEICRMFDRKEERRLIDYLGLKVGWSYKEGKIIAAVERLRDILACMGDLRK